MKAKFKVCAILLFVLCMLTQVTFGDVIVEKDAIGVGGLAVFAIGGFLLVLCVIAVIWSLSWVVIRTVRNKNVNK